MLRTAEAHAPAPTQYEPPCTNELERRHVASARRLGRAIVVDDDVLVRLILADALEATGFEVLTAANGVAGLQLLSETILTVGVLITDVLMPGLDGVDFVRTIRTVGGETELRIIAVTASEDPFRQALLFEAGADLVLQKSLGPSAIAAAAESLLARNEPEGRRASV